MCVGRTVRRSHQHLAAVLHFKNGAVQRRLAIEEYDHEEPSATDNPRIAATQVGTIMGKFVGLVLTLKCDLLLSNVVQSRQ